MTAGTPRAASAVATAAASRQVRVRTKISLARRRVAARRAGRDLVGDGAGQPLAHRAHRQPRDLLVGGHAQKGDSRRGRHGASPARVVRGAVDDRRIVLHAAGEERALGVLVEDRVVGVDHRAGGAEVAPQVVRLGGRRDAVARGGVGRDVGASKSVDGLLGIADQVEGAAAPLAEDRPEDLPLDGSVSWNSSTMASLKRRRSVADQLRAARAPRARRAPAASMSSKS